ncbi:hypothetical protein [Streptomyces sp. S465]|uniref:hypothetical protein n=1 Tax=Streptomyces sp. S465 TaxID=2979468 RepID=UPI0022A80CC9|nr:hypothetical protein [Streptomyces sp. S465]WAP61115.1 hypothetical protein N6H00_08640 [Streptomyces sp. S465]
MQERRPGDQGVGVHLASWCRRSSALLGGGNERRPARHRAVQRGRARPEDEALKLFTQRVEGHRNEQRRRQQQLDHPTDQAASSQLPAA